MAQVPLTGTGTASPDGKCADGALTNSDAKCADKAKSVQTSAQVTIQYGDTLVLDTCMQDNRSQRTHVPHPFFNEKKKCLVAGKVDE